jgi:hypothetical protein
MIEILLLETGGFGRLADPLMKSDKADFIYYPLRDADPAKAGDIRNSVKPFQSERSACVGSA